MLTKQINQTSNFWDMVDKDATISQPSVVAMKNKRQYSFNEYNRHIFMSSRQCGKTTAVNQLKEHIEDLYKEQVNNAVMGVDIYIKPSVPIKKIKINFKIEEKKTMRFKLNKNDKMWALEIAQQYTRLYCEENDSEMIQLHKDLIDEEIDRIKVLNLQRVKKNSIETIDLDKEIKKNFDIKLAEWKAVFDDLIHQFINGTLSYYQKSIIIVTRRKIEKHLNEDSYKNTWLKDEINSSNTQGSETELFKNGKTRITAGNGKLTLYVDGKVYSAVIKYNTKDKFYLSSK